MGFINTLDIVGSGLTAQKMRIDILTQNMVNAEVTRTEDGTPYRRQMVVFEEKPAASAFGNYLGSAFKRSGGGTPGVQVSAIIEDDRAFKTVYDPEHPHADENGLVLMPNVDKIKEMSDALSATRAYEANITMANAIKLIAGKALEIGRG